MKRVFLSLIIVIILLICISGVSAVADGKTITITGIVGDYSSKVILRTDSNAGIGTALDGYDMRAPSSPSDYVSFYSIITGSTAASVDSWSPAARTLNLVYGLPAGFTGGVIDFSWNNPGSDYKATFRYYGATGGYAGNYVDSDMDTSSTYSPTLTNDSDIYIQVIVADEPAEPAAEDTSGGGGGGRGATIVQQPQINIIFNISSDKLLFDAGIIITDEFKEIYAGEKMRSVINLQPMGITPNLDVYLRYYITDKNGIEVDVGDAESETIKITGSRSIDKTFFTNNLEPGEYTLHLELKYESEPGKFLIAEASSQFVVLKGTREEARKPLVLSPFSKYKIPLLVLGSAILVLIILIIVVLSLPVKRIKKRK